MEVSDASGKPAGVGVRRQGRREEDGWREDGAHRGRPGDDGANVPNARGQPDLVQRDVVVGVGGRDRERDVGGAEGSLVEDLRVVVASERHVEPAGGFHGQR